LPPAPISAIVVITPPLLAFFRPKPIPLRRRRK
jgi:hypothetical protein